MSTYIVTNSELVAIANAIRARNSSSDTFTIDQLPNAIATIGENIGSGAVVRTATDDSYAVNSSKLINIANAIRNKLDISNSITIDDMADLINNMDPHFITDSWDTIIANIDNGTYSTKYEVGDYKPIDLGSTYGVANMQIVAMDTDELVGGGYAPLTFLSKEQLNQASKMNSTATNANGFPATDIMKPLLNNTLYPLLPTNVKNRIQTVNKTYYDYTTNSTLTTTEKIFIPSRREMFGGISYETSGVMYTSFFTDAAARRKPRNGESKSYWLRTACKDNNTNFMSLLGNGSSYNNSASTSTGICLGFCLGAAIQQ